MAEVMAAVALLEEGFVRRTPSRRAVLEAVASWRGHFSAEEVCRALPSVGRATVYRTLASLQQTGVLCRVFVEDGGLRYQLGESRHHHHLVCQACGAVQNISGCGVDDFVSTVAARFGYQPQGHRLEIYGQCPSCRDQSA